MYAKRNDYTGGFKPFSIQLEVPNEEVARALYAIFNLTYNVDLLPVGYSGDVKDAIGREHVTDPRGVIANGVTYKQFYQVRKED